jgi:hypothetical protein
MIGKRSSYLYQIFLQYHRGYPLSDISQMPSKFVKIIPQSQRQGGRTPSQPADGMIFLVGPHLGGHSVIFIDIRTHFSRCFLRNAFQDHHCLINIRHPFCKIY